MGAHDRTDGTGGGEALPRAPRYLGNIERGGAVIREICDDY